jgi:hypothetical protein
MTWKSELDRMIHTRWRKGQTVTVAQLYDLEEELRELFPENNTIRDKIRQTVQYLRDDGVLSFIDNSGTYLILR